MKKFLIIALSLLAASCENAEEFKGTPREPKMILGAVIGPNDQNTHDILVKESVFIFGTPNPQSVDALFTITRNGTQVEHTTATAPWIWVFPIEAGDRIELTATSTKHGTITASDVVPAKPNFKTLKTEWFQDRLGEWYLRTPITIADPAGERNYYRFRITSTTDYKHGYLNWSSTEHDYVWQWQENSRTDDHGTGITDAEIAFTQAIADPSADDMSWSAVSDELFDGREYTFNIYIKLPRQLYKSDDHDKYVTTAQRVTVQVQSLSENLFKYVRSADILQNVEGNNFAEPARLFTNVGGGYGILGTYNTAAKTAQLEVQE